MSRKASIILCILFGVGTPSTLWSQTPVITDIVDAGAYTAGIAPGSLFVVKGTNLCASTAQATLPYKSTPLGGVAIQWTPGAGGAPAAAYMEQTYCANGYTQLAAVLPSTIAAGNYNVTVTNNGVTSPPFAAAVTPAKFGVMTLPGSGSGRALVQNVVSQTQYDLNGFTTGPVAGAAFRRSPATPGQYLVIWGMGLGAAMGFDSSAPAAGLDFLPQGLIVQVIVGGMRIAPAYAGRSNLYPGLDNVVVQLPSNVPTGCDVTLQVRAGGGGGGGGGGAGHLSNVTTIAIAPLGAPACVSPIFNSSVLSRLDQNLSVTVGRFLLGGVPGPGGGAIADGEFFKATADQFGQAAIWLPAPGTCEVASRGSTTDLPPGMSALDAGLLTVNGPGIPNQVLSTGPTGEYNFRWSPDPVATGNAYTISGTGGKDIGPFSVTSTVDPGITLANALPTIIPRTQDLTISWTGGAPDLVVTVYGSASAPVDADHPNALGFACTNTADQGKITVPASILSMLPATPPSQPPANLLQVWWHRPPTAGDGLFSAPLTTGGDTDPSVFLATVGSAVKAAYQ